MNDIDSHITYNLGTDAKIASVTELLGIFAGEGVTSSACRQPWSVPHSDTRPDA